mgnify:CR=1 FL=1
MTFCHSERRRKNLRSSLLKATENQLVSSNTTTVRFLVFCDNDILLRLGENGAWDTPLVSVMPMRPSIGNTEAAGLFGELSDLSDFEVKYCVVVVDVPFPQVAQAEGRAVVLHRVEPAAPAVVGLPCDLAEYDGVPAHMLDIVPAGYRYNLFEYIRDASRAIDGCCGGASSQRAWRIAPQGFL